MRNPYGMNHNMNAAAALLLLLCHYCLKPGAAFATGPMLNRGDITPPTGTHQATTKKTTSIGEESTATANNTVLEVPSKACDRCELFYQSLQSFESKEAMQLLEQFQQSRTTNSTDTFLQELVSCIPESTPWWAKWNLLARTSRRARWESCRQAWRNLTPPATNTNDEDDEENVSNEETQQDDAESLVRRQRRAILSLLRTLSQPASANGFRNTNNYPAIRQIERRAAKESKKTSRRSQLVAERRPKDLETPRYTVLYTSKSGLEIRRYDPYSVCTFDMMKDGNRSYNPKTDAATAEPAKGNVQAFGALAGYLFGKNQEKTAMKMTTPVFMSSNNNNNNNSNNIGETATTKSMSFVLPSDYWDATKRPPPQPLEESGVRIETVASEIRAVLPFGGYARNVKAQSDELRRQLQQQKSSGWIVDPTATVQLAQYNDPFTPPWKRLNEVSIAVVEKKGEGTTTR